MKTLSKVVYHGSRQGKATGWQYWPGFAMAHFTDGSTEWFPDVPIQKIVEALESNGVDVNVWKFTVQREGAIAASLSSPPIPEGDDLEYQNGWSYEKPVSLGPWSWSSTFGRWGRIVTFANGWRGLTWPKTW